MPRAVPAVSVSAEYEGFERRLARHVPILVGKSGVVSQRERPSRDQTSHGSEKKWRRLRGGDVYEVSVGLGLAFGRRRASGEPLLEEIGILLTLRCFSALMRL